ncbi:chlorophyll synthase ChlG [Erythrobacter sp. R86502]|uniref:chlorophyll synthase ChlG n=1 Tax=Erythrobacter sp. R86502 TaxID=3093846 RepID=UPI0036D2A1C9
MEQSVTSTRTVPNSALTPPVRSRKAPRPRDVLELLKPITWFPPMWAFMCGAISSGAGLDGRLWFVAGGILLAGPLVCGTSQAVNDWFDRHVDAINEPHRPIPSGRIPGRWGLYIAIIATCVSAAIAWLLGPIVFVAGLIGLAFAWAYSAPPLRFKANGWVGPLVCGLTYEGLSWFTGAAVMIGTMPSVEVMIVLVMYSLGAHGIMVLNDFKAVEGDRQAGLTSLPVVMGIGAAARLACVTMASMQIVVIALLAIWGLGLSALIVTLALGAQIAAMPRLLRDPARHAPWYNGVGVTLYVLGMLAAALGLGGYI